MRAVTSAKRHTLKPPSPNAVRGTDRSPRAADARILERSDTVLWTIAGDGILLHNFARRRYLELDALGYAAWGFLDGARTVDEVVARCTQQGRSASELRTLERRVRRFVDVLVEHGFIGARSE